MNLRNVTFMLPSMKHQVTQSCAVEDLPRVVHDTHRRRRVPATQTCHSRGTQVSSCQAVVPFEPFKTALWLDMQVHVSAI